MWNGIANEPKTRKSKAPVPVIAPLARKLETYHHILGNPASGPMFANAADNSTSLNNVLNRTILPAQRRCAYCGASRVRHSQQHAFVLNTSLPAWHGWHAFRRGLATNLHRMGVDDKVIQAILRHGDLSTTQNIYIKDVPADTISAMRRLEAALCADRALEDATAAQRLVN